MEIFPAIDILGGNAVRLTKGDYNTSEIFSTSPQEIVAHFKYLGATNLHLVDLDGAKSGSAVNFDTIKTLANSDFFIEVGGGIRDESRIKAYLDLGVSRVILGTIATTNFDFLVDMVNKYGDKIAVGVDAKNGYVATNGWTTVTDIPSFDFVTKCRDIGVKTVIYTDIDTDGEMRGTNMNAMRTLSRITGIDIVASGGISSLDEIVELRELGIYAGILGKAYYKGLIKLDEAIILAKGVTL